MSYIEVYLGMLNIPEAGHSDSFNNSNIHRAASAIIHPKYSTLDNDIALLEVARDIVFDNERIGPICLPYGADFPDGSDPLTNTMSDKRGYVAGWGVTKNEECHTGRDGPLPYTKCHFPFTWNGIVGPANYYCSQCHTLQS